MVTRHEKLGIKQVLRYEWMQKAVNLCLAGLDTKAIRQELHEFLSQRKGDGSEGGRSDRTRTFVVDNLVKIWIVPDSELVPYRDALLAGFQENRSTALAAHWAMVSAAYPFWFNVARQTGRLLNLQDQVTQPQIINRLKEQYGDRQTITRYAQYVIRSFVAWGALRDSETKGCYVKGETVTVLDQNLVSLMVEAALHANPEGKETLGLLLNAPAFFPFQLLVISGSSITQGNERVDVIRYGLDDELLKLKTFVD